MAERVLRALARVLPSEFRERVFEPALEDLRLAEAQGERRPWARVIIIAECLRLGVPQYLWRRGRPTAVGVAILVAVAVGALAVMRLRYAAHWQADGIAAQGR